MNEGAMKKEPAIVERINRLESLVGELPSLTERVGLVLLITALVALNLKQVQTKQKVRKTTVLFSENWML